MTNSKFYSVALKHNFLTVNRVQEENRSVDIVYLHHVLCWSVVCLYVMLFLATFLSEIDTTIRLNESLCVTHASHVI